MNNKKTITDKEIILVVVFKEDVGTDIYIWAKNK